MYWLQTNVEVVAGAKNYCIYDLNAKRLYSMDGEYADYLNRIIDPDIQGKDVPEDVTEYFLKNDIVVNDLGLLKETIDYKPCNKVTFAWIEITQNCNLKCKHCYEEAARGETKPKMTYEDFVLATDFLAGCGIKRIQLVGGEPLMHEDIAKMIDYVSGKFDFVEIFTNGTLLTEELFKHIKAKGIALAFSIYSTDPKCHDGVTCTKGSYDKTSYWIEKALSEGVQVRISSVEMEGVPKFSFHDDALEHRTDFPRLCGRADLSLYSRDMLMRKFITKDTFKKPIEAIQVLRSKKFHNCFSERLYIDCFLDVYPCVMERRIKLGNVRLDKLKKTIDNDAVALNKDNIEECKDCEFRYACYDCRPDCGGDTQIDSKPWYCTYDPYDAVWRDKEEFAMSLLNKKIFKRSSKK